VRAVVQLADREFQLVVAMATTSRSRVSRRQSWSMDSSSFGPEAPLLLVAARSDQSHRKNCSLWGQKLQLMVP